MSELTETNDMLTTDEEEKINRAARAYLRETDWYVVRQAETGAPIPMDVAMKRRAARDRVR